MACASEQDNFQQWLAQINQVCGRFAARPLEGAFLGELETSYTQSLKLSTVTAAGVNLFRTRQEIKNGNDAWFYTVFQLEGSAGIEQYEAALEAMVCLLRPPFQQRDEVLPRKERQFRHVLSLIDDHIQSEALRPEWIASESGMSVRSLYRMFAGKGLVVAQYIKNRRLDLCAQALRSISDDEKLAGIGYSWGFTDHSHFSTAFKQRFGVSPGEYRRRYR